MTFYLRQLPTPSCTDNMQNFKCLSQLYKYYFFNVFWLFNIFLSFICFM